MPPQARVWRTICQRMLRKTLTPLSLIGLLLIVEPWRDAREFSLSDQTRTCP